MRHMKTEKVKVDSSINELVWGRGLKKIPTKVRVKAVKTEDVVWVYTPEAEIRHVEEEEKKKKKAEKPEPAVEEPAEVQTEPPSGPEPEEPAPDVPSEAWTKNQLFEYARERDIPVNTKMRKAVLLAVITEFLAKESKESVDAAPARTEAEGPEEQSAEDTERDTKEG